MAKMLGRLRQFTLSMVTGFNRSSTISSRAIASYNPEYRKDFPTLYSIMQQSGLSVDYLNTVQFPKASFGQVTFGVKEAEWRAMESIRQMPVTYSSVILRNPDNPLGRYYFSSEFEEFAAQQEVDLGGGCLAFSDPERRQDHRMEAAIYKTIVQFGQKISEDHPIVFRDVYLCVAQDLPRLFWDINRWAGWRCHRDMSDEEVLKRVGNTNGLGSEFVLKWTNQVTEWLSSPGNKWSCTHIRSLPAQLSLRPEDDWYKYASQTFSGLPWTMFRFLRTLPSTPFDPLSSRSNSNVIDPYLVARVYEKIGLIAAADADKKVQVGFYDRPPLEFSDWFEDEDSWR